jgi:hypothetical protein
MLSASKCGQRDASSCDVVIVGFIRVLMFVLVLVVMPRDGRYEREGSGISRVCPYVE